MRVEALLIFVVGCCGIEWEAIKNLNETFQEYSADAVNTISSIKNILNASRTDLELFLNDTYTNNPIVSRLTKMKYSEKKCFARFIDRDNMKMSLEMQNYQLQIPLQTNIVNIREKLNYINSSLGIYQRLAESKLLNCNSLDKNCSHETDEWLEKTIHSLYCTIFPNCSNHSIKKRSTCLPGQFKCNTGQCISSSFFCDYVCQCSDCSDQPPGCVRSCSEFRCRDTFRCISLSKKCNGIDECGDGSDEDGCPPPTIPTYSHVNCSKDTGNFLCETNKCISLEQVCDGYDDCGDWSDEDYCNDRGCSPECGKKGGVCFTEPNRSQCLYECPPGTYETSQGCNRNPEAPLGTLIEVLEDIPRLTTRYAARLEYLKTKTIMALSKSLREVANCKKDEFTSLSKIIDFSRVLEEEPKKLPDTTFGVTFTYAVFPTSTTTSSTTEKTTSTTEKQLVVVHPG
nr:uncharacterized protein LOC106681789 [Halyomorpha halys]